MHVSNWNCADMPKKKPHCNPVSVRLVCVYINERRLICLCAHFAHLCMDRSWPETRLEPSNLLRLSPSPCCAKSSPNAAAESLQTGAGDIKTEGRRAKKSGNRRGNQGEKNLWVKTTIWFLKIYNHHTKKPKYQIWASFLLHALTEKPCTDRSYRSQPSSPSHSYPRIVTHNINQSCIYIQSLKFSNVLLFFKPPSEADLQAIPAQKEFSGSLSKQLDLFPSFSPKHTIYHRTTNYPFSHVTVASFALCNLSLSTPNKSQQKHERTVKPAYTLQSHKGVLLSWKRKIK